MGNELFKNIPSKVGDLVKDVRNGRIGLPDLQRPFVWKDNKVRELFDSMLKGYPIGYIMLWESPADYESKKSTIGDNSKTYEEPKELVIDGQQRLTALVAAMFAVKVKDKNFADREIKISYNPLTREFAVWSQAYEKDTEWISRISDVFLAKEDNSISSLRRHFIREANEGRSKKEFPLLTDEEEDRIEDSINALLNLSDYSLPTLEISYNADEENVADIFVRVNSGGQSLTENNFIQTLISVYENETSDKINTFAAASRIPAANTSYNTLLAIEPSHLIRMAVGFGFKRARLKYAYMLLRGKNLETGKFSDEVRHDNLQIFKDSLDKVMNLNNWHNFINIVAEAGYISDKLIASSNAIVFSYVLYLIAKYASKLVNRKTKSTVHKKSRDEADVKPFYVVVVIPKDTEISKAQRGLILFQEIGIYGVKTVTTKAMQEFFSKKLGLTFRTQNLAPDFYLKKLFESGMIQKIKLARNVQSNDTTDKLYGAGYGREERTLVPIKITNQMKAKLRHVSEAKYNYFTFDNHDYPETKMVVKIGDRLRTIDLHGLDELSVEEALPDELLLPDGTIDFPNFETHMLEVAEEYIEHLPNKF